MRTEAEVQEAIRLLNLQQPALWIDAADVLRWVLGIDAAGLGGFDDELKALQTKDTFDRVWEER